MKKIVGYVLVMASMPNLDTVVKYDSIAHANRAISEGAEEIWSDEDLWGGQADEATAAAIEAYYAEHAIWGVYQ